MVLNILTQYPFVPVAGTRPSVVHANGWDKGPLIDILTGLSLVTPEEIEKLLNDKARLEKTKTLQIRERNINAR